MIKYKLICKKENEVILGELFKANKIMIDMKSSIILCEYGMEVHEESNVIISFKIDKINDLLNILRRESQQKLSLLMGRHEGNYVPIEINEVIYFNAYGNETFANTFDGKQYKIKYKLYELENEVLTKRFIRINKSEIVNIKYIIKITPMFNGKLILKIQGYKEVLDISRNYIKEFKERIGM